MTPARVVERVKHILSKSSSKYYGRDRINEDIVEFYHDLLVAIANGKCQSPSNCAQLALIVEEPHEASALDRRSRKGNSNP